MKILSVKRNKNSVEISNEDFNSLVSNNESEQCKQLEFKVKILDMEIDALRSVLSEWDRDKSCFLQMNLADALYNVRMGIK